MPAICLRRLPIGEIAPHPQNPSDGGTLSNVDRQIFMSMAEGTATPDEIRDTRISSLVRKWMDGGRLTLSERDEIAHLLPDALTVNTDSSAPPQQSVALVEDDVLRIYEISRAKYFRWKQVGAGVPDGPDAPPYDDPRAMVSWYERMRERGIFKHKCPRKLKDLATKGLPASTDTKASSTRTTSATTPKSENTSGNGSSNGSGSGSAPRIVPEQRGFLVEHEKLEEHTAILREDYLQAYAEGRTDEGHLLKQRYFEAYEMLRKSASQKEAIGLSERSLVKRAEVIEILGVAIPSAIDTIASESESRAIFEAALSLTFDDFHQARRSRIKTNFASLHKSGFVPPYELAS